MGQIDRAWRLEHASGAKRGQTLLVALLAVSCGAGPEAEGTDTARSTDGEAASRAHDVAPVMTRLPSLGGSVSSASFVNARGDIAGFSTTVAGVKHAVLWRNGIITDLGALGDAANTSTAAGLNGRGQVAGVSPSGSNDGRAFLWSNGVMLELGTLAGGLSVATGLNDHGQVVGNSINTAGKSHAFLWENGTMLDLGSLHGDDLYSNAAAINDRGQVVGVSVAVDGVSHPFLWENGVMKDLGVPGAALRINGRGSIIGFGDNAATGYSTAFLWRREGVTELGTTGGDVSFPNFINERDEVVGVATPPSGQLHAFYWAKGTMLDLGTLGGTICNKCSTATAVNVRGQVVGRSVTAAGEYHAFLWERGEMLDLGVAGESSDALAINDRGVIVGSASSGGETVAVEWTTGCRGR